MKIPVEHASEYLKNNLKNIPNIQTWAAEMGWSRASFCRRFKQMYGVTPGKKMAATRKQKLEELLFNDPACPAEILAGELGLPSAASLCKYLSRHFNTTLRNLRKQARELQWLHKQQTQT